MSTLIKEYNDYPSKSMFSQVKYGNLSVGPFTKVIWTPKTFYDLFDTLTNICEPENYLLHVSIDS